MVTPALLQIPLTPAKAGVQSFDKAWVPASAGTSGSNKFRRAQRPAL